MSRIIKLSEEVINKIAAGEIIQRPYNIIKELVENSIDAKSDQIFISCINKEICDNGVGIDPEDFPLLCERFATSKISNFEDLKLVNSFGFRGEALASISYIANITVESKREERDFGFKAIFQNGKLKEKTEAGILTRGTKIKVENIFYNMPARRQSAASSENWKGIVKLIQMFALHYSYVTLILINFCRLNLN